MAPGGLQSPPDSPTHRERTHTHKHLPEWQVPRGRSTSDLLSINSLHYFAKSLLPPNRLCVVLTTKGRRRKSGNVGLATPTSLGHFMTRTYTHKAQDHTLCHFRGPQEGKAASRGPACHPRAPRMTRPRSSATTVPGGPCTQDWVQLGKAPGRA